MKRMFFYSLLLTCLIPTLIFSQDKKEKTTPDYAEAIRLIDAWLEAQQAYDQLPGISVAIVHDQEIFFSKGYGLADLDNKMPCNENTIYSICSISKLFTAVAVMQLYDAGKLRLDDQVEDVLPWFKIEKKHLDSGPITIRSLLTHSSGLPRESDYPYWTGPDFPFPSAEQVKAKLDEQETLYPASTYFQYSNLGLTLLGAVVEEISGQSYDEYVSKNILEPLRLQNTATNLPATLWRKILATGYSSKKRDGRRDRLPLFQAEGIAAAAGYSSTVEDLARFASWQFRLRENGGEEILKASTLREMQRVHWVDPDWKTAWGLGFVVNQVDGKTMVGHGGSCPGYRSALMIRPDEKMAFVVMINASGEEPAKYANGMRKILEKVDSKASEKKELPDLEAYAGRYDLQPWWGEITVLPWQDKLVVVSMPADDPAEGMTFLKHIEGDTFRRIRDDEELGEEIRFEREDSGKVVRMWQHSNYRRKIE